MRQAMRGAAMWLAWALLAAGNTLAAQAMPPGNAPPSEIQKAVEEFKRQTRELGLRADSPRGRAAARPAGNRWHGRLFNNLRNDYFDAIPHEVRQAGGDKRMLRRNQFGFNVSGPVYIPRVYDGGKGTFFSVSYEGVREKIERSYLRTIPIPSERVGDWSVTVDPAGNPLQIYDPASTRPNPHFDASRPVTRDNLQFIRDVFPAGKMPDSRLSPVAQKALRYYPEPNVALGPFFRNNYFVLSPETNKADGMIFRLDHALRERHRFSWNGSFSNGLAGPARFFPNPANPGPPDRTFSSRRASLEHTFTISPKAVNSVSFEASTELTKAGEGDERRDYAEEMGLSGASNISFPHFFIDGYLSMGRPFPESRNARHTYILREGFSIRSGKHNLRLTGIWYTQQVNSYWPQYPAGRMIFRAGLTSLPGIVNTGHGFASFLLGLAEFGEITVVQAPAYFRRSSYVGAINEQYELTPRLMLSAGLEFTYRIPRREKYDRQSTIDPEAINPYQGLPGALVAARTGRWGRSFQPNLAALEPRASLSWSPFADARTVLRVNYARSYEGYPLYFGHWGTQGFVGTPTWISANRLLEPAVTLNQGFPPPPFPFPDLRPEAANDTVADFQDTSGRMPTYQRISAVVERQMPFQTVVTVGAYQSYGRNMLVGSLGVNLNPVPLEFLAFRDALNDEAFVRRLRLFPQYQGFDVGSSYPIGKYKRDATFVRLEKRASAGLTVSAYYEFAKQMDDYSGPNGVQDPFNRRNEWSLTNNFRPHQVSLSYVYELPLGPNRPYLNYSDWRRHLVGGWALSGETTWYSGDPIVLEPQFNNTGRVVRSLRVNVVPGVDPKVKNPGPELWFNPAAFDQPPDFTIGDASRTHPQLRNPGQQNHDLSVRKRFEIDAERSLEVSAVGLNFINTANWNDPDAVIGPATAPNVNAGRIIGSRGGRIIQVGLRFSF